MKLCKTCKLTYTDKFEFCPKCGNSLVEDSLMKCPNCAKSLENNYVFCPYCGYDLQKNNKSKEDKSILNGDEALKVGIKFEEKENHQEADKLFKNAIALGNKEAVIWHIASPDYNLVEKENLETISKDIYDALNDCDAFKHSKTFERMYCLASLLRFMGAINFEDNSVDNINYKLAFKLTEIAALHGVIDAIYALAIAYEEGEGIEKDYNKAFMYYEKAVEQGSKDAIYHLGTMYKDGKGVVKDLNKAIELYQKAAEKGVSDAQNDMALMYFSGDVVTKDYAKAFELFEKAALQDHREALYYLGFMYENEFYVKQDYEKAQHLYEKALAGGFVRARDGLKRLESRIDLVKGENEKRDIKIKKSKYEECFELANMGDINAIYRLAEMYYYGTDIDKDYEKAYIWYSKAGEQGFAPAQHSLGLMYEKGYGVAKDFAQAIKWYSKAAEQDYALSLFKLGQMYKVGQGVKIDYRKALELFRKAAKKGNSDAYNSLGLMYFKGKGVTKNIEKAIELFTIAANQGVPVAQYNLGHILETGYDKGDNIRIVSNIEGAKKWYRKAADNGYEPAKTALEKIKDKRVFISYGPAVPTKNEMEAFLKICQVAEHGASFSENWKALGYSYPKTDSFFGALFQSDNYKKAMILQKKLIDTIVAAGLKVIGLSADSASSGMDFYGKVLNNKDLQEALQRKFRWSESTVEYLFRFNKLSTNDAARLENVFKMISLSYSEIFIDMYIDFKK